MRWLAGIMAMPGASLIQGAVIPENHWWQPTAAGVSVGRWTPLPVSLMWRFDEQEQDNG